MALSMEATCTQDLESTATALKSARARTLLPSQTVSHAYPPTPTPTSKPVYARKDFMYSAASLQLQLALNCQAIRLNREILTSEH